MDTMGGGVAPLDYDGDGRLDIFPVNGGKFGGVSNVLFHNDGAGRFRDVSREFGSGASAAPPILKRDCAKITGSIGPNADDRTEVSKGGIEGSDVTLEAVAADQQLRVTIRLTLDGEKLAGEFKAMGPDAPHMTGEMNLERAK